MAFLRLTPLVSLVVLSVATPVAGQDTETRLAGRLLAVDGGPVEGVRVRAGCAAGAVSALADSAGLFALSLPCPSGAAEIELVDTLARYLRARPTLAASGPDTQRIFLLVPRVWTIRTGSHAGSTVPIDLPGATEPACSVGCSAFYTREDTTPSRPPGIPVWLEHSLPLRLAFSEDDGIQVSEADSMAFMRVAESLEADLGRRWFQPARFEDIFAVGPEDRFGSLIVGIDPLLRDAGRGNWAAQGGEIVAGVVYFQSTRLIRDPAYKGIVAHELMHALGYGHTCSWRSVLTNDSCRSLRAEAPTAEDVAHAQLLLRLRTLERRYALHGTIRGALAALD